MNEKEKILSLIMIVKDEESNLKKCLESCKDIFDEIIIVDTGSKDNTKKIAKKYTDKVCSYKWRDDFSKARNYAIGKSTCKWIFWLDADEELLGSNLLFNWKQQIKQKNIKHKALLCPVILYFNNKPIDRVWKVKLFKRGLKFKGKIHESIDCSKIKDDEIAKIDFTIVHWGYNDDNKKLERFSRNLDLLLKQQISLKTEKEIEFNIYNLGCTYYYGGFYYVALKYFEKIIESKNERFFTKKAQSYYVDCIKKLGKVI